MSTLIHLVSAMLRLPLARRIATRLSDRDVARSVFDAALDRSAAARLARRGADEMARRARAGQPLRQQL